MEKGQAAPGLYNPSMEKYHFTYQNIHKTAKSMADRVKASGFDPDVIVAIGSGGFIPARIIRTYLGKPILAVGIAYYDAHDKPTEVPRKVQWIEEAERKLSGKKILLIDEVDDSRATLEYCIRELMSHHPAGIAVAVLHNKDKPKKGSIPEEVALYIAGEELPDVWIVYPWDAQDIDAHDAAAKSR
ncbi:MAG: phosphoribosyltransferase [Spirochaetes bacterium]|nr:MAG: phosphoribosyltransferase [Spirochaetota bacterium]